MVYTPPAPSIEEQKKWPCRFTVCNMNDDPEVFVPSIMSQWRGDLGERSEEQMKADVELTVEQCMRFLQNCYLIVHVLRYNSIRNTWPIHTTYDGRTKKWSR